jgi:polyhydroxyalkanoate synthesis regulator phasin
MMTNEELVEHYANLKGHLDTKRRQFLTVTNLVRTRELCTQIDALRNRVRELERQLRDLS